MPNAMEQRTTQRTTLGGSRDGVGIEGDYDVPPQSLKRASVTHTTCTWKREERCYGIEVNDHANKEAAWSCRLLEGSIGD
jgi:hypothetical protein